MLTSERLIFGSVVIGAGFGFRTAASLHAVRAVQPTASHLGEALLRIALEGPGAGAAAPAPVLLRFGRGAQARAQRDSWLGCIELMRRAYLHGWALATDTPIARAAHCVACAAALSDPSDGSALLGLLPAHPPRVRASRLSREVAADRWQLLRLSGLCGGGAAPLRILSIAAAGSGLAVSTRDGTLLLFKVRARARRIASTRGRAWIGRCGSRTRTRRRHSAAHGTAQHMAQRSAWHSAQMSASRRPAPPSPLTASGPRLSRPFRPGAFALGCGRRPRRRPRRHSGRDASATAVDAAAHSRLPFAAANVLWPPPPALPSYGHGHE